MPNAPEQIITLVENFKRNLPAYQGGDYKEEQLKQEFINPFFEALGWDVSNRGGAAPQYRDVIFEDSIKVGGGTRAPDYCYTLSGRKMFFVEAKKPSVNVLYDKDAVYQLRRYAWSAQLPLSILTNFEKLIIYESRKRPKNEDNPSTERVRYYSFEEYLDKWDEIANVFSKNAVLQGSFDKFVKTVEKKHGTQEVDDEFLIEIEGWRDNIAKNIAMRNENLSIHDLNFAVQVTIDRIIFLRMCEDRGIEPYGQLQEVIKNGNIYKELCKIYKKCDDKYNSGLFHFDHEKNRNTRPDEITLKIDIDDTVLKGIIKNIYYPDSPYEFSVLSPEILGNIYERFLGKIIRLTEGHHAKVEEKPEVKKAGGVYYTPKYIVDYIVENTVGKLCEKKSPKEISTFRILDPACGSGSFLLGAYSYLLKYHLEYYSKQKKPERLEDQIYLGKNEAWVLTIKEKKRILLNNIYGVDIDPQAVEVTKLSLLLKVLEGENKDVFERQQKLWQERALPDLGNNIKCGNSLIGPDIYSDEKYSGLENEDIVRINAFDWKDEFKSIMDNGGFDAVIGNPPYVRQELIGKEKQFLEKHFQVYQKTADLYSYFIERGITLLNKQGKFAYIVANKWMRAKYGEPLRNWLSKQNIEEIIDFGDLQVFSGATTYPCILLISNNTISNKIRIVQIKDLDFNNLSDYVNKNNYTIDQSTLDNKGWTLSSHEMDKILTKIKINSLSLREYIKGNVYRGILSGLGEAFIIDENKKNDMIKEDKKSIELIKPFLLGKDVKRYFISDKKRYIILIPSGWTKKNVPDKNDPWIWFESNYPAIAKHLKQFEDKAKARWDKGEYWWELRSCDYYGEFEKPKIMYLVFQVKPAFILDSTGIYGNNAIWIIPSDDKYLLGLLNSKCGWFLISKFCTQIQSGYQLIFDYFGKIPIRKIDLTNTNDKTYHDRMVGLVTQILDLYKQLVSAKADHEKNIFQRQIDAIDKQIDSLVYELYGLTTEEIKIVEDNVK